MIYIKYVRIMIRMIYCFPTSKDGMAMNYTLENMKPISSTWLHLPIYFQHIFSQTTRITLAPSHIFSHSRDMSQHTSGHTRVYASILPDARSIGRCYHQRFLCSWNDVVHHRSQTCKGKGMSCMWTCRFCLEFPRWNLLRSTGRSSKIM